MPSLIFLRKMLATLDRARRENRPYWFALTVPFSAKTSKMGKLLLELGQRGENAFVKTHSSGACCSEAYRR